MRKITNHSSIRVGYLLFIFVSRIAEESLLVSLLARIVVVERSLASRFVILTVHL